MTLTFYPKEEIPEENQQNDIISYLIRYNGVPQGDALSPILGYL